MSYCECKSGEGIDTIVREDNCIAVKVLNSKEPLSLGFTLLQNT